MTEFSWRPSKTFLIAGTLVLGGLLLCSVSWWFMLMVAAGTFGPGILRESGLLHDKDEFETVAMYRAGYHAYLVSGVVAFAIVAFVRSSWDEVAGTSALEGAHELGTLFAAILWCSWMFSTLFSFWGAVKASRRILVAFGCVWLLFNILGNTGSEWTGPMPLLMQSLLSLPFFLTAWLCGRWPKVAGVILLAVSVRFLVYFGWLDVEKLAKVTPLVVSVLFIGPLLATGIALAFSHREEA